MQCPELQTQDRKRFLFAKHIPGTAGGNKLSHIWVARTGIRVIDIIIIIKTQIRKL
jgi:hypothetical protein